MKIHQVLRNPNAVLVVRTSPGIPVGWDDFRQAGQHAMAAMQIELEEEKVVIKPNVTSGERIADPNTGITTHPGFVHGMIDYLKGHGGQSSRITIAEDPRDTDDNLPRHWTSTGYDRVSLESGAKLHTPAIYTCIKKQVPSPLIFDKLNVSRLSVASNTVLFNVPKFKTHNLSITSLCMKNLMGLINVYDRHYCVQAWDALPEGVHLNPLPKREWFDQTMHARWQEGLARRLADTAKVIQPTLNVIEGIVGREGTGFQRGRNRVLGLVIAGVNLVAVDSLASYLMGFDPQRLIYLKIAAEAGIGENDIRKLLVYILQEGELTLCPDVHTLRIVPPFLALSGIMGEDPNLFRSEDSTSTDPIDSPWFK